MGWGDGEGQMEREMDVRRKGRDDVMMGGMCE